MQFQFDIEPDQSSPETLVAEPLALAQALPPGFNLPALLRFLPDVRLKQRAEADATAALAIDVSAKNGLLAADAALIPVRADLVEIEACFKDPTDLANQLHKRLTGLRADFCAAGKNAIEIVGRRIYTETRRLDDLAAEVRRKAQAEADRQTRAAAARAAQEAATHQAPPAVVEALKEQARVGTAPPVAAIETPVLPGTAMVQNWKARLLATPADAEPNPETKDLTEPQRAALLLLLRASVEGRAPLARIAVNWPAANDRAKAERTTMRIDGLEAFDQGGTRSKGRRQT